VRSAVVVVQPPPVDTAMDRTELDSAVEEALNLAREAGVRGGAVTPFLLEKLSELTGKASLDSNLDLLRANADLAAELAQVTARRTRGRIGFV
jgi:pseudouridine-5'-phosphate glycosidase